MRGAECEMNMKMSILLLANIMGAFLTVKKVLVHVHTECVRIQVRESGVGVRVPGMRRGQGLRQHRFPDGVERRLRLEGTRLTRKLQASG